jgi:hypothetical protein
MSTVLHSPTPTVTPTPVATPTPVRQRRTGRIVALVIGLIIVIAALAVGAWALFFRGESTTALTEAEQIALAKQRAAVYYPVAAHEDLIWPTSGVLPVGHGLVRSVTEGLPPIQAAPLPNYSEMTSILPTSADLLPANGLIR